MADYNPQLQNDSALKPHTSEWRRRASLRVCAEDITAEEARELLAALGLLPKRN